MGKQGLNILERPISPGGKKVSPGDYNRECPHKETNWVLLEPPCKGFRGNLPGIPHLIPPVALFGTFEP